MPKAAGILLWRPGPNGPEILLAHFGGPFWADKDSGAWSIPKGIIEAGEDAERAARREFREEVGHEPPATLVLLDRIRQKSGKWVTVFLGQGDLDPLTARSNMTSMEWPPRSGRRITFPEVDRVGWFHLATARAKLLPSLLPLLARLDATLPR